MSKAGKVKNKAENNPEELKIDICFAGRNEGGFCGFFELADFQLNLFILFLKCPRILRPVQSFRLSCLLLLLPFPEGRLKKKINFP